MDKVVVIIDCYDSFTYNIVHYIESFDYNTIIYRPDNVNIDDIGLYNNIIISPGPGKPNDYPIVFEILKKYHNSKKILGICLGHQIIGEFYGMKIVKSIDIYHGKTSNLLIKNKSILYNNLEGQIVVGRYHSWIIESVNNDFIVTAISEDTNEIMSIEHKEYNVISMQYHPESIMTNYGKEIIKNWLYSK